MEEEIENRCLSLGRRSKEGLEGSHHIERCHCRNSINKSVVYAIARKRLRTVTRDVSLESVACFGCIRMRFSIFVRASARTPARVLPSAALACEASIAEHTHTPAAKVSQYPCLAQNQITRQYGVRIYYYHFVMSCNASACAVTKRRSLGATAASVPRKSGPKRPQFGDQIVPRTANSRVIALDSCQQSKLFH